MRYASLPIWMQCVSLSTMTGVGSIRGTAEVFTGMGAISWALRDIYQHNVRRLCPCTYIHTVTLYQIQQSNLFKNKQAHILMLNWLISRHDVRHPNTQDRQVIALFPYPSHSWGPRKAPCSGRYTPLFCLHRFLHFDKGWANTDPHL